MSESVIETQNLVVSDRYWGGSIEGIYDSLNSDIVISIVSILNNSCWIIILDKYPVILT
jgi:hypothetical protein